MPTGINGLIRSPWCRESPASETIVRLFVVHAEKSFLNLIKSTRYQIVFTIFRFILEQQRTSVWFQINQKIVNIIWFRFDLIRFRKDFSVCIVLGYLILFAYSIAQSHMGYHSITLFRGRADITNRQGSILGSVILYYC